LYLQERVQRPIEQHPAAGSAARMAPTGTPEGMAGRVMHRHRGGEPSAHFG
jgi:hypothetical protein